MFYIKNEDIWNLVVSQGDDMEFDWMGIDKIGQVAIFSNFNQGYVPGKVTSSLERYNAIFKVVEALPFVTEGVKMTNENANFEDWENYSKKGLFAYDLLDIHRQKILNRYDLIYKPRKSLLLNQISGIHELLDSVPSFNLVFISDISFDDLR